MTYVSKFTGVQIDMAIPTDVGNTIAFTGASLTGQVGVNQAIDYFAYANYLLGGRFKIVGNVAVGGDTTTQALLTLDTLLSFGAKYIFICPGIVGNGIMNDHTLEKMQGDMTTIYEAAAQNGRVVITTPVPPGDQTNWYSTTARQNNFYYMNLWIKQYAEDNGIIYINTSKYLVDGTGGTAPKSGVTSDGIHVNALGAFLMGKAIAEALDVYVPQFDVLPLYSDNILTLNSNPLMLGTSGAIGSNTTGTSASGVTVEQIEGGSLVASKVARTDGLPGEWQRLAITPNSTGTTTTRISVVIDATSNIGDMVEMVAEMNIDGTWTGLKGISAVISCWEAGFASQLVAIPAILWYPDTGLGDLVQPVGYGVWRSRQVEIPTGSAVLLIALDVYTDAGGSGTADIGRFSAQIVG